MAKEGLALKLCLLVKIIFIISLFSRPVNKKQSGEVLQWTPTEFNYLDSDLLHNIEFLQRQGMLWVVDGSDQMYLKLKNDSDRRGYFGKF